MKFTKFFPLSVSRYEDTGLYTRIQNSHSYCKVTSTNRPILYVLLWIVIIIDIIYIALRKCTGICWKPQQRYNVKRTRHISMQSIISAAAGHNFHINLVYPPCCTLASQVCTIYGTNLTRRPDTEPGILRMYCSLTKISQAISLMKMICYVRVVSITYVK